jgi:uncharacterized repeat protein (TIGR03803 family)
MGTTDGAWPSATLLMDSAGNLYGTAVFGGNLNCESGQGCGTVFKLDPAGKFSVLHAFSGPDGMDPEGLIEDGQGNLYGTAAFGGPHNHGVVYKLTP